MTDKPKPCPFCGSSKVNVHLHKGAGTGYIHHGDDVYSIGCYQCGGSVPNMYSREKLLEAWNRRNSAAASASDYPRWEFDPLSGYIIFSPDRLTKIIVAELHSSNDKYALEIVEALNALPGRLKSIIGSNVP